MTVKKGGAVGRAIEFLRWRSDFGEQGVVAGPSGVWVRDFGLWGSKCKEVLVVGVAKLGVATRPDGAESIRQGRALWDRRTDRSVQTARFFRKSVSLSVSRDGDKVRVGPHCAQLHIRQRKRVACRLAGWGRGPNPDRRDRVQRPARETARHPLHCPKKLRTLLHILRRMLWGSSGISGIPPRKKESA